MSYQEKYHSLAKAVQSMRYWQRRFFKHRRQEDLNKAREHEGRVDTLLRDYEIAQNQLYQAQQKNLF